MLDLAKESAKYRGIISDSAIQFYHSEERKLVTKGIIDLLTLLKPTENQKKREKEKV